VDALHGAGGGKAMAFFGGHLVVLGKN